MRLDSPYAWRVGLLLALMVVVTTVALVLPERSDRDKGGLNSAPACPGVLIVGVDGDGQTPAAGRPFGRTIDAFASRIAAGAAADGRSVGYARIPLATSRPRTFVTGLWRPSIDAIDRAKARAWRTAAQPAVSSLLTTIRSSRAQCPQAQVVVLGYSQGALAAHRAIAALPATDFPGLVGAVLVSDPLRYPRLTSYGHPAAARRHPGLFFSKRTGPLVIPGTSGSYRTFSVCSASDLVCAPDRTRARTALGVHADYHLARPLLDTVARAVVSQVRLWPVPTPAAEEFAVTQGVPFSVQLTVSGGSTTNPRATWRPVSELPTGVTLSSSGVLSGQLSSAGDFPITYAVRGVAPVTTETTGTVQITSMDPGGTVTAGGQSTCSVHADHTAWCWGNNNLGQFGNGTTKNSTTPVQVRLTDVAQISTSGSTSCAVRLDGSLWCWGLNNYSQLALARSRPVLVPVRVGVETDWQSVSNGYGHTCALKTTGSLWCWGQNMRGQLGTGAVSAPVRTPVQVGAKSTWTSVTTGGWHTCAVRSDGRVFCWGYNAFGQLGDGTTTIRVLPRAVLSLTGVRQISASYGQTCAVTLDQALFCWGHNDRGQLGDGSTSDRWSPVPVGSGTSWATVAVAETSSCATSTERRVFCWGDNRYLQAASSGPDSLTPRATPVQSSDTSLVAGWMHFCTDSTSATPSCWGLNENGQLGVTPVSRGGSISFTPRAVPPGVLARGGVSTRPAVTKANRGRIAPLSVMSFNVLGSQHTFPIGGDRPEFALGRVRAEWGASVIARHAGSLVGLQESQPDQIGAYTQSTAGRFGFWPGNRFGYTGATQSLMWDDARWQLVWGGTFDSPFMHETRPQPVVRLRDRSTGKDLYFVNVHFSPGKMTDDRRRATTILIGIVRQLTQDRLPILVTGDFNDSSTVFCRLTGATTLVAANGGSNKNGVCTLPRYRRVDWIFGSRGTFANFAIDTSNEVHRATDHSVLAARFSRG